MAIHCPYCGHAAHATAMYMTCEESTLCQQCGLSESDAWLRRQEEELVARFSAYSISPQDQQIPAESKVATNRIVYASAAAHSFIMPPMTTSSQSSEATWVASTDPQRSNVIVSTPSESIDMEMDSDFQFSDTATTDSKRSSVNVDHSPHAHFGGGLLREVSEVEPYMSLGYEHDHNNNNNNNNNNQMSQSLEPKIVPGGQLANDTSSTRAAYSPCKDPVYNARSWWDYGGELEYRWDCMREHAI